MKQTKDKNNASKKTRKKAIKAPIQKDRKPVTQKEHTEKPSTGWLQAIAKWLKA